MSEERTPDADTAPAAQQKETAPGERAKALYYAGETDAQGRPAQFIAGVPARDLNEFDLRVLADSEYASALASGLYRKTKPKGGATEKGA